MAWDDLSATILQALMNDYGSPPLYTSDRYNLMFLIAGLQLQGETRFQQIYRIDLTNTNITPDPTTLTVPDNDFLNLGCLKSSILLINAEIRDMARQGIDIQDGTSRLRLQRDPGVLKQMLAGYEDTYQKALYWFKAGGDNPRGEAIVSPYPYWGDWPWGMGSMYEGYGGERYNRPNIGGLY